MSKSCHLNTILEHLTTKSIYINACQQNGRVIKIKNMPPGTRKKEKKRKKKAHNIVIGWQETYHLNLF